MSGIHHSSTDNAYEEQKPLEPLSGEAPYPYPWTYVEGRGSICPRCGAYTDSSRRHIEWHRRVG